MVREALTREGYQLPMPAETGAIVVGSEGILATARLVSFDPLPCTKLN